MSLFQDGGGQKGRKRFSRGEMFQLRSDSSLLADFGIVDSSKENDLGK